MPRAGTKQAPIVGTLSRVGGATIQLVEVTGWKPNTMHAALSTLHFCGRRIAVEEERRYRITAD